MKKIRSILLAQCLVALGLSLFIPNVHAAAPESVTKVGNGNDGADLENLTPITSGPIIESKQRALKLLDRLNIVGIPGLGLLIPEIERTELLMASEDAHPTGEQQGSLEISDDKKLVYARTFAEPYAATRFFPAAKKLSSDQLVALHIHEALHRALPESIREDENAVMHFTMAITSPGANFDRIHQVSKIYIKSTHENIASTQNISVAEAEPVVALPEKSQSKLAYEFNSGQYGFLGIDGKPIQQYGLEYITSLSGFKLIRGYAIEPAFRARLKFAQDAFLGPSSFDLESRFLVDEGIVAGPFIRFTTKSIDESNSYKENYDRDIVTFGGFYRLDDDNSYFDVTLAYSLPSTSKRSEYIWASWDDESTKRFEAIFSLYLRSGYKWKGLHVGGIAEVHSTDGYETTDKSSPSWGYVDRSGPLRVLLLGPELGYKLGRYQLKTYYKILVNNSYVSMDDFGDPIDRGTGRELFGASLAMSW